jgi:uncharacterized coiled-coil DUF342 family protein
MRGVICLPLPEIAPVSEERLRETCRLLMELSEIDSDLARARGLRDEIERKRDELFERLARGARIERGG